MPSSAPIIQAEFGSSVLAMFSYIVPDVLRVACQMSSVVLSKYLQSVVVCCLGCQMSFNCAVRAPSSSVTKCFQCTVRVPSIRLGKSLFVSHCHESPDVLAKYLQSAWGVTPVSAARCLLMYCQSTINLPGGVTSAFCASRS